MTVKSGILSPWNVVIGSMLLDPIGLRLQNDNFLTTIYFLLFTKNSLVFRLSPLVFRLCIFAFGSYTSSVQGYDAAEYLYSNIS